MHAGAETDLEEAGLEIGSGYRLEAHLVSELRVHEHAWGNVHHATRVGADHEAFRAVSLRRRDDRIARRKISVELHLVRDRRATADAQHDVELLGRVGGVL